MVTKKETMKRFARNYREKIGRDATMNGEAMAWKNEGRKMPEPTKPFDVLAKEIAGVVREEMLYDEVLDQSYNANIGYTIQSGDKQLTFWCDIDRADRKKFVKNVQL